ncbi:MAG: hypothetical protein GWN32_19670 [Gemmatimonadetes bacterium]|nr:septum formation initiator family protein [Gemmatimonadota bacterium]NIW38594.1 hypothetical protein [Gemmatimonadota bacterium]NIY35493.1 hypothetical protein [Gemmatimonadota bacterium]
MAGYAVVAMLLLAAYFAVFGGEYSIFQISRLEDTEAAITAELARIEAEMDSLEALKQRLESDPVAIERVARERYGMIRDGEVLYRFREVAGADSTKRESPEGKG